MTTTDFKSPPPMDDDLENLLRFERERPRLSGAQVERMWRGVTAELALLPLSSEATVAAPTPSPDLVAVPLPAPAGAAPGASTLGRVVLAKAYLPWIMASVALGGSAGLVAGHRLGALERSRNGTPASSVPHNPAITPGAAQHPEERPAPIVSLPVAPSPPLDSSRPGTGIGATPMSKPSMRGRGDLVLSAEQRMIEQADNALRRGDWATALKQTDAYASRFPHGELAEENAYLGVRACREAGDQAGARARLDAFRKRFPLSPLGVTERK